MGIYHDPRWNEILGTRAVTASAPPPRVENVRALGYRSVAEMQKDWDKTVAAMNWNAAHQSARKLITEYYEDCRQLRIAINRKMFKADSIQEDAVDRTFNALSFMKTAIETAKDMEELGQAHESYLKTAACKLDHLCDPLLAEYEAYLDELKRKELIEASQQKLTAFRLGGNAQLRKVALGTSARYDSNGQPICHMVCVAVDMKTGATESGRAGHGLTRTALENRFGFSLPTTAANSFTVSNPYNCAELDALYQLMGKNVGVDIKQVYFASMMPGGSFTIPPCANCQRWIKDNGAKAARFNC